MHLNCRGPSRSNRRARKNHHPVFQSTTPNVFEAWEGRRLLSASFKAPVSWAAGDRPDAVATGDFNGDGTLDLAVANFNGYDVSVLLGSGNGGFSAPTNFPAGVAPDYLAVGDFN